MKKGKKHLYVIGSAIIVLTVIFVLVIYSLLCKSNMKMIPLMDSVNQTFGWTYEKLNDGVVTKTEAEFNEEYGTIIKGGHADAVKMTRVMTPVDIDGPDIEVTIINPETLGVEIFVDGEISYSSFGRGERNKAGYMIIDEKILQNFPLVKGEEKLCVFLCLMTM